MKIYLLIHWYGSCAYDYYEEKLGIFSSLEQAEKAKSDYIKSFFLEIGDGEGFDIYEFELDNIRTIYK